jgi:hypothetical protein
MTIGDGIFWSTVLILLSAAIYQISIRKKWKLIGKTIALLFLFGAVGGATIWGWYSYNNLPSPVAELNGIRLGMSPVEVKLVKGPPSNEQKATIAQQDNEFRLSWEFSSAWGGDESTAVIFYGATPDNLKVAIICGSGGYSTVHGLGRYNNEKDIIRKLGQPTSESINSDGLSKFISFKPLKVAYELTKGQISQVCVTEAGGVGYTNEYQGKSIQGK